MFSRKYLENVTRKNVLALDCATHCGFYHPDEAGTWDLKKIAKAKGCGLHRAFAETLRDFCVKHDIKIVAAENVSFVGDFIAMRRLSEIRGVLYYICDDLGLPEPCFIDVAALKKWATNDSKADKAKMIEFCRKRWGIDPIDDNMADAAHIFNWFVQLYQL